MEYVQKPVHGMSVNQPRFWMILFSGVVLVLVLPTLLKVIVELTSQGIQPDYTLLFIRGGTMTFAFMVSTPLAIRFAINYPVSKDMGWKHIVMHILGIILFIPLLVSVDLFQRSIIGIFVEEYRLQLEQISIIFLNNVGYFHAIGTFVYFIIMGWVNIDIYYTKYWQRRRSALELETRLTMSKVQLLKMQLHPHFLFNTLNAIITLIHRDKQAARDMIANLTELLQTSTQSSSIQYVTLAKEIDFIRRYLDIERMRFGENLEISYQIGLHEEQLFVPTLILQPLVENAVKHGTARKKGTGRIDISASVHNDRLLLHISDNGPGLTGSSSALKGTGIGIANTKARLWHLFRGEASIRLENRLEGGVLATLELPLISALP